MTAAVLPASEAVLTELGRYFAIAIDRAQRGQLTPMFSSYLDDRWHELLEHPDFDSWCRDNVGRTVDHRESSGSGRVGWVAEYERRHGALSELWFTDADGRVNEPAIDEYRSNGTVTASWRCNALDDDYGDD